MILCSASVLPLLAETTSPCGCPAYVPVGSTGGTTEYRLITPFDNSRCYLVKGILVVDNVGWINMRIKMEEGAEIFVTGTGLTLINCYISGCDDMWRGIKTDNSTILSVYGTTIEDAEFGISLGNFNGFHCEYTKFINDYIGIAVGSPFEEDIFDQIVIQKGEILGCEFYTDGSLPNPYPTQSSLPHQYYYPSWPSTPTEIPYNQGYAAFYICGASGMNLGKLDAESPERNKIHDMRNGIITRYSLFDIFGTDIYDLEGSQPGRPPEPILDLNQYGINEFFTTSTIQENVLDNLMVGVFQDQAFSTIGDNDITLLNTGPAINRTMGVFAFRPQSLQVKLNSITDGYFGVFVANVNTPFSIVNNTLQREVLYGGNTGIYALSSLQSGYNLGNIFNNVINIEDGHNAFGIDLQNNTYTHAKSNYVNFLDDVSVGDNNTGIEVSESTFSLIEKNHVYADGDYLENEGNFGINLEGSRMNYYVCNDIDNFNDDIRIFGSNNVTQLRNNEMIDGDYGLNLVGYVQIGVQKFNGNLWTGSYNICGANIDYPIDPVLVAISSKFLYDPIPSYESPPSICPEEVDMNNWFVDAGMGPETPTCVSDSDNPITDPDTLVKIVRTPLDFEEFNDELTWIMKADIYELMVLDPGLHSETPLDSFFDVEETNPLGKLVTWQLALSSRFGDDNPEKAVTQDTLDFLREDLWNIDGYLSTNPSDSVTWMALRALKVDTLNDKLGHWLDLLDYENDESLSEYSAIADDLDNLTTTSDIEEYLRQALYFKSQYLLGEEITSGDSLDIYDLTQLCPWEAGRAVYVAQELYSLIADTIVSVTLDNCAGPSPFKSHPNDKPIAAEWDVFSFPNPTNDQVQISSEEIINKVLVSNTAREQLNSMEPKKKNCTVDLSGYPDGIYVINIFTDRGQISKRIMLIK